MVQGPKLGGADVEPVIIDAVKVVRDRFGASGLRSLVTLASDELARVEEAESRLAAIDSGGQSKPPANEPLDAADTQAWKAYTEADPD